MNDVLTNKIVSLQRCIARAREEYRLAGADFEDDYTHQDAAVLNLIRACETALDIANYIIRKRKIGLPQTSSESFHLLAVASVIPATLGKKLEDMIGFRNLAVHQYTELDMARVADIIQFDTQDLLTFTDIIMELDL